MINAAKSSLGPLIYNDTAVAAIRQYPGLIITLAFFCTLLWLTWYEIEDTTGFCGTYVIE